MNIELISFKICPFVQRSVITLLEKQVAFSITYIDLAHKPDWFVAISPLGKVPVLKVNDKDVLFESAVINEFLDDVTKPKLMPGDPLLKAKQRAWIEFTSAVLGSQYGWMVSNAADYNHKQQEYFDKLDYLNHHLEPAPLATGDEFSLLDAALAPALMRHSIIDKWHGDDPLRDWPNLAQLQVEYGMRSSIQNSVDPHFESLLKSYLQNLDAAVLAS